MTPKHVHLQPSYSSSTWKRGGGIHKCKLHCVSKNDTDVAYYNFDVDQAILIILAGNGYAG